MPLIYVTGIAGAGKSTVQKELTDRGYEAYDLDDPTISGAFNNETGEFESNIPDIDERTEEWRDSHSWRTIPGVIDNLKREASNKVIFLCGIAENDPIWVEGADEIVCLDIDERTLRHRIITRKNNDFGKSLNEMERLLKWHKTATQKYRKKGATVIDATQPVDIVVDKIIDFLNRLQLR